MIKPDVLDVDALLSKFASLINRDIRIYYSSRQEAWKICWDGHSYGFPTHKKLISVVGEYIEHIEMKKEEYVD